MKPQKSYFKSVTVNAALGSASAAIANYFSIDEANTQDLLQAIAIVITSALAIWGRKRTKGEDLKIRPEKRLDF